MGGHDQYDLFSRSLKGHCYGDRFLARIGNNWHVEPSFHKGCEYHDTDGRVGTAEDRSMPDKI